MVNKASGSSNHSHDSDDKKECNGAWFFKILFIAVGVATVLLALGLVWASVVAAVFANIYFVTLAGRTAGAVALNVTAFVTFVVTIVSLVRVLRKLAPRHVLTEIILLALAIVVQVTVLSVSMAVTPRDRSVILNELVKGFNASQNGDVISTDDLNRLQSDFHCCGIFGPKDYSGPLTPIQVPASCCPDYDINDKEPLHQEGMTLNCRAKQLYYKDGCNALVVSAIQRTSAWTFAATILLILFEIAEVIMVAIKYVKAKNKGKHGGKVENRTQNVEGGPSGTHHHQHQHTHDKK